MFLGVHRTTCNHPPSFLFPLLGSWEKAENAYIFVLVYLCLLNYRLSQNIKLLENCEFNYLTIGQHSLMRET